MKTEDDTFKALARVSFAQLERNLREAHLRWQPSSSILNLEESTQRWYTEAQLVLAEGGWTEREYWDEPASEYLVSTDHRDYHRGRHKPA